MEVDQFLAVEHQDSWIVQVIAHLVQQLVHLLRPGDQDLHEEEAWVQEGRED